MYDDMYPQCANPFIISSFVGRQKFTFLYSNVQNS